MAQSYVVQIETIISWQAWEGKPARLRSAGHGKHSIEILPWSGGLDERGILNRETCEMREKIRAFRILNLSVAFFGHQTLRLGFVKKL
jgi:hypothetical protein